MADKSSTPQGQKPGKPAQDEQAGYHVTVGGDIKAGRDVVMRDQYNYNQQDQRVAHIQNIHTPTEFVLALQQVQAELAALRAQPELTAVQVRRLEAAEGDLADARAAAENPAPADEAAQTTGERINATLVAASETLENLQRRLQAAGALGATIAMLAQIALKVFGG